MLFSQTFQCFSFHKLTTTNDWAKFFWIWKFHPSLLDDFGNNSSLPGLLKIKEKLTKNEYFLNCFCLMLCKCTTSLQKWLVEHKKWLIKRSFEQRWWFFGVFSCPFKHRLKMLKKYTKSQEKGGSVSLYSTLMNWIWTKINTIETL